MINILKRIIMVVLLLVAAPIIILISMVGATSSFYDLLGNIITGKKGGDL